MNFTMLQSVSGVLLLVGENVSRNHPPSLVYGLIPPSSRPAMWGQVLVMQPALWFSFFCLSIPLCDYISQPTHPTHITFKSQGQRLATLIVPVILIPLCHLTNIFTGFRNLAMDFFMRGASILLTTSCYYM